MMPISQKFLGTAILLLLVLLVLIKRAATGSILEKPKGNLLVQLVNFFNLFFLLVVIPLAGICLITYRFEILIPARSTPGNTQLFRVLEISGIVLVATGYFLMAWALITLGRNYQLGGSAPRSEDELVIDGPYKLVRHPMYTAVLSISIGLACLMHAWLLLSVFCIYLVLIILLIPEEEEQLRNAYSECYGAYQQKTWRLLPFVY